MSKLSITAETTSTYAWVINRDYIADEVPLDRMGKDFAEVDVAGPHDATPGQLDRARSKGWQFKMYDDDGILYYTGRCWAEDGYGCEELFGPLDDYGKPNAGAVRIDYLSPYTGEWETL